MTDAAIPAVRVHAAAIDSVDAVIGSIGPDQWSLATPCSEWDVRALVNHLASEALWTPPLLDGRTIAEVGSRLDGDLLGADPIGSWTAAKGAADAAAQALESGEQVVHLSFGDFPAAEYLAQLSADYLIHGWDLAVTLGLDDRLDADLVASVGAWFGPMAAAYRDAGVVAAADSDPQTTLLAEFGRSRATAATRAAVNRFGAAFDRRDVDAIMAAMTADCAFESTGPPDGTRHEGQAAVRAAWTELFASSADASFATEELIVCGDRAVARWRYTWGPGADDHVRGVDVFHVRDGLVAEKLSYVKG